jgi:hypothetical protein
LDSEIDPHPSTLPLAPIGWETARLPALYMEMVEALKKCESVDECMEWKRKAEAFASYYRQAKDQGPRNMARRIWLRAWRRCGELFMDLDRIDSTPGDKTDRRGMVRSRPSTRAAKALGMFPTDRAKALALAALPEDEFEAQVSKDPPPAMSKLVQITAYPHYGMSPEQRAAASVVHALGRIFNVTEKFDPDTIAAQITDAQDGCHYLVSMTREWLNDFAAAREETLARNYKPRRAENAKGPPLRGGP